MKLEMSVFTPFTTTWPWPTIWRVAQMVRPTPRRPQDVVQARLEQLDHRVGRVALGLLGHGHEAAELLLEHAVVEAKLLLLDEAHAVLGIAPAAVAVHAGELKLLGRVLGDVRNGNADAARQLHLRAGVTGHGGITFCVHMGERTQDKRGVPDVARLTRGSRTAWF
jgi:hypothetical protein